MVGGHVCFCVFWILIFAFYYNLYSEIFSIQMNFIWIFIYVIFYKIHAPLSSTPFGSIIRLLLPSSLYLIRLVFFHLILLMLDPKVLFSLFLACFPLNLHFQIEK